MNTLFHSISEVVRSEWKQQGKILLEEKDPGSTCKPITLEKEGPALVLQFATPTQRACQLPACPLPFSMNDHFFPVFRTDTKGLTVLCDYIIFYPRIHANTTRLFVFLCELKSGRSQGARKQAENGRLLADYIVAMAKHHITTSESPEIVYREIVFSPNYQSPKGNLQKVLCNYQSTEGRMPEMKSIHYRDGGSYHIHHFCA